ncbi:MAG TPA: helix-turn-helix domain-containing protein [Acidimicrobiales bacterium]|nr:helix-turn-helix domain-containing protein [Acidimicrobiales bacterium]
MLSRESPSPGDEEVVPPSLSAIASTLRQARQRIGLTVEEAASHSSCTKDDIVALERGDMEHLTDRVETLRTLRSYADSLGLSGDAMVLAAVSAWPPMEQLPVRPIERPLVSVSSAPVGGHTPAGGHASLWPGDATGVTDSTITGVVPNVRSINDTGQVPIFDTGQVPAVRQGAPFALKLLTTVVALLVVLGGVGLLEHKHVSGWYDSAKASTTRWVDDARKAVGLDSKKTNTPKTAAKVTKKPEPKVDIVPGVGNQVIFNVHAASFTVKMAAVKGPCWMQVTGLGQLRPIYAQVMPAGQNKNFVVTSSVSIETASSSGRAYVYEGKQFIGYYFPTKVPFTMVFNAEP